MTSPWPYTYRLVYVEGCGHDRTLAYKCRQVYAEGCDHDRTLAYKCRQVYVEGCVHERTLAYKSRQVYTEGCGHERALTDNCTLKDVAMTIHLVTYRQEYIEGCGQDRTLTDTCVSRMPIYLLFQSHNVSIYPSTNRKFRLKASSIITSDMSIIRRISVKHPSYLTPFVATEMKIT